MTLGDRIEMQIYAYADGPAKGQPRSMTVAEILAGLLWVLDRIEERPIWKFGEIGSSCGLRRHFDLLSLTLWTSRQYIARRTSGKKRAKSREKKSRHHVLEIDRLH